MYARVIDNQITEIVSPCDWLMDDGQPVTEEWLFEKENLYKIIENLPIVDDFYQYVEENPINEWIINDNNVEKTYEVFNISIENLKENLKEEAHRLRKIVETSGLKFIDSNSNELHIFTDRDSQSKVMAAYSAVKDGLRQDNSLWKTIDGFVAISNDDILRMAQEMLNFIQGCFDTEKTLIDEIDIAQTIDDLKNIDFSNWPTNALKYTPFEEPKLQNNGR